MHVWRGGIKTKFYWVGRYILQMEIFIRFLTISDTDTENAVYGEILVPRFW